MNPQDWCPDPDTPQVKDPANVQSTIKLSHLCERGWQPLLITGFLRDFLIRQWISAENILAPEMKKFLWSPQNDTGIVIESVSRFQPKLVNKRPAIMIKRNAMTNVPLGMRGKIHNGGNDVKTEKGAFEQYATQWAGSHTLFCIHGTSAAAELLATEIKCQVLEFSPVIRRELRLHQCTVANVDTVQELEESTENYVVPITVGWVYEHTWQLKLESLPLKTISLANILSDTDLNSRYQGS